MTPDEALLVYRGDGSFLPDVPARDLAPTEIAHLDPEMLLSTGLYEEVADGTGT